MASGVQSTYLFAFVLPFIFALIAALLEHTGPGFCASPDPMTIATVCGKYLGGIVCFGVLAAINTV